MADDRKAFEAMLDELGSSSDEEADVKQPVRPVPGGKAVQEVKGAKGVPVNVPMNAVDAEIQRFGESKESSKSNASNSLGHSMNKRWLMSPCPAGDPPMLCIVERHKPKLSMLGGGVLFKAYLETPSRDGPRNRFLMSAKKQLGKGSSYYLVSLEEEPVDRGSESLLGKVRGNSVGSKYLVTDHGMAPDKSDAPSTHRKELGFMKFEFDSDGPSKIQCWLPAVNAGGAAVLWQPSRPEDGIESFIDAQGGTVRNTSRLMYLNNKKPKWDDAHGGHVLNFHVILFSCVSSLIICIGSGHRKQRKEFSIGLGWNRR